MIQPKNPNLKEITTQIQAKRGNRQFFDTKHRVSYITYASGYVRREIKALCTAPYDPTYQYKCQDRFVINKITREKKTIKYPSGFEYSYSITGVIKETCPQKRMDIIDRISSNYKGYKGRFTNKHYTLIEK